MRRVFGGCRRQQQRPLVDKVSPPRGPVAGGTQVRITGRNFNGASAVRFGTADATFQLVSDAEIVVPSLPHGPVPGTVDVVVTAAGESTPAGNGCFEYLAEPVITSVISTGDGRVVGIVGRNLVGIQAVYFGAEPAKYFKVPDEIKDEINVEAGRHRGKAGPTQVNVVTPGGVSAPVTVRFPADRMRTVVVAVSVAYMLALIAGLLVYINWPPFGQHVPATFGPLPLTIPWFGAVGAVLLSVSGLVDHFSDWDSSYVVWHLVRPLIGAVMGSIGTLIIISGVIASTGSTTLSKGVGREIFYDTIAFLIGYREETFRTLIKRLTDVVLGPGDKQSTSGDGGSPAPAPPAKPAATPPAPVPGASPSGTSPTSPASAGPGGVASP